MTIISVSGVFSVCWVEIPNLTQLQPSIFAGFRTSVSGVSGLTGAQAYARKKIRTINRTSFYLSVREKEPDTPDTPNTVKLNICFIMVFIVLGVCRVVGFLCRVRFSEVGR